MGIEKYACGMCGQPVEDMDGKPIIPAPEDHNPSECILTYCWDCQYDLMQEEYTQLYVTREMALDAGIPELEGTLW